jgi:hypothetical protein
VKRPTRPGVYRAYPLGDWQPPADRPLYIGSTDWFGLRMSQHEREQPWWGEAQVWIFEPCDSREEAYVVEDEAIVNEDPVYNKRRNFSDKPADEELSPAAGGLLIALAPCAYMLAKWAYRDIRRQFASRHAATTNGPVPPAVVSPFSEDTLARRMMVAAFETVEQLQAPLAATPA